MSAWQEKNGAIGVESSAERELEPNHALLEKQGKSISWRRVLLTVSVALVVIVPTMFHYSQSGSFLDGANQGNTCTWPSSLDDGDTGFDLSSLAIPAEEILHGGPAKDGIPALTGPATIPAADADYLSDEHRIIGVSFGGEARAYPLNILTRHEIVNDKVGTQAVAVTYCPLCDSAAAFDRRTALGLREFGVSGLLYNSNVLMYDRAEEVESLWSQVLAEGISGPGKGTPLSALPLELTTWGKWKARYPATTVLSTKTGHTRDYHLDPYAGYFESRRLMFPVNQLDDRLPPKQRVLGVWSGDSYHAYPESAFNIDHNRLESLIDGKRLVIEFDAATQTMRVSEADEGIQWMYSFWFAWYAMHPDTELY